MSKILTRAESKGSAASQSPPPACRARRGAGLLALIALAAHTAGVGAIQFQETASNANILYTGETFGGSWGDRNGDGWPDLFVNNHRNRPSLYVNQGDGTFEDRWFEADFWHVLPNLDQHGASWTDFDNDGDQDLFVSLGATDNSQFFVNNGQTLDNVVLDYAFDVVGWSGRLPVWYDYSADGWLDFSLANRGGSAHTFRQVPGEPPATRFVKENFVTDIQCYDNQYIQLGDISADGSIDVICAAQTGFPDRVKEVTTIPFPDITTAVPMVDLAVDSVIGDFDGDLQTDMLVVRGIQRLNGAEITGVDNTQVQAALATDNDNQRSITFQTTGDVTFRMHWDARNAGEVHIGAEGWTLAPQPADQPLTVTLSPTDSHAAGIQPHDPAIDFGIYIGYEIDPVEPTIVTWTFDLSSGGNGHSTFVYVDSTTQIGNLQVLGQSLGDQPLQPVLLLNQGGTLVDSTLGSGLDEDLQCVSANTADFDNDMDLDVFMVCRGAVSDLEDIVFENNGNGTFTRLAGTGAEGPSGFGVGHGENVIHADYDVDGFIDLFVTNGLLMEPRREFDLGGADRLYRNVGNTNNWVQLDLVGTTANRMGVGAVVTATASGTTQVRTQNGGYHRWAQDSQRIHFGLAANATVDVTVQWPAPSTQVDTYTGLAANALYRVTEGVGIELVQLPSAVPPTPCYEPEFDKATEAGVFLWKDCFDGDWSLRVTGGGGANVVYDGLIGSDAAFTTVTPFSAETNDVIDFTSDPAKVRYTLMVGGTGIDGIDFMPSSGSGTCLYLNIPEGQTVQVGHLRRPVTTPLDLETMGPCDIALPIISVADIGVAENAESGVATFTLTLSEASPSAVSVDVETVDGTAVAAEDYTALVSTTVTFEPGVTEMTVDVALVDDSVSESDESFSIVLSNAVGALVIANTAVATIVDDEISPCGQPAYNKATESGVFLWQDCATGTWSARMTGGGGDWVYEGRVVGQNPFTNVAGFSIEANDVLDNASDPSAIDFALIAGGSGQDGFDFAFPATDEVCFRLNAPALPLYVGAARTVVDTPVNLVTMDACATPALPTVSLSDLSVAEDAGTASVAVTLSAAAASDVTVEVSTANGTAVAPDDYTALSGVTVTIPAGNTVATVAVTLVDDALAGEGNETFTVSLANPVGALAGNALATVTIVDDEISPCGRPVYDRATESGVFLWQDCATGTWSARMTGGGGDWVYEGRVVAQNPFSNVTGFSIEASDVLDNASDPSAIDFALIAGGSGQDGFDFAFPATDEVCFRLNAPALPLYVGAARTVVDTPVNLVTMDACATPALPTVSLSDLSVAEDAGTASVAVTLSAAAASDVTVEVSTANGTAVAPDDYTALSGVTVTIPAGNTVATVAVTLVDDALAGEGNETFTVSLANPVGALAGNALATVTIVDDEISPCGRPVYDKATESGVFLWKNCDTGTWSARMPAGGSELVYQGSVTADQPFASVSGFSIESEDTFDHTTDPQAIAYTLLVTGTGQDGMDFALPAGTDACFRLDGPAGQNVFVGAGRVPVANAVSLSTLGACP